MSFFFTSSSGSIGIPVPNRRLSQPSTYDVLVPPASLPVSLIFIKEQLGIEATDVSQDTYLTTLIDAARDFFEKLTGRVLINTQFRTFFTRLVQAYELRRSKFQSLQNFQYLDMDLNFIAFDSSIYYETFETDYSRIIIDDVGSFPTDKIDQFQSVRVDFTAGYGTSDSDVPSDIKLALGNHVANMYSQRGDCSTCSNSGSLSSLPTNARNTYTQYIIPNLYGGSYRGGF